MKVEYNKNIYAIITKEKEMDDTIRISVQNMKASIDAETVFRVGYGIVVAHYDEKDNPLSYNGDIHKIKGYVGDLVPEILESTQPCDDIESIDDLSDWITLLIGQAINITK